MNERKIGLGIKVISILQFLGSILSIVSAINLLKKYDVYVAISTSDILSKKSIILAIVISLVIIISVILILLRKKIGIYIYIIIGIINVVVNFMVNNVMATVIPTILLILMCIFVYRKKEFFGFKRAYIKI